MTTLLNRILAGQDHLCSHPGSSQYSNSGSSSACGLAAMNCARYILSLERQDVSGPKLVEQLLLKETMDHIMSICSSWTSNAHLEVDDIYSTPLFQTSLKLLNTLYGRAEPSQVKKMLSLLNERTNSSDKRRSRALVITRPPEIVACLKIVCPERDLFVIFDSHPRPAHPDGAAFFFSGSMDRTLDYLSDLFPQVHQVLAADSRLQWQAELLAHVSGHFFEFTRKDMRMSRSVEQAFIEANCAALLAKTQENEALSRCSYLLAENKRLQEDSDRLKTQMEALNHEVAARIAQEEKNLCGSKHKFGQDILVRQKHRSDASPTNHCHEPGFGAYGDFSGCSSDSESTSLQSQAFDDARGIKETSARANDKGKGKAVYEVTDDFDLAVRMHLGFQAENAELAEQFQYLQNTFTQETFDCAICMDQLPIDDVARLDGCEHLFCRGCIRQHISTKLEERKVPIFCPCCAVGDNGMRGSVSVSLVHQIGISEEAYKIFNELQITKFSVPIHCRKCDRSAFADKSEFEQSKILFCPFPNCSYSWCKDCQQEISTADGPIHSCDGTEEFNHLLVQRGWKLCPGCKTPTEKTEGCNHMTCGSPGCNTHFCYICGQLIVRSTHRAEINAQVSSHYRSNCALFSVPPEN